MASPYDQNLLASVPKATKAQLQDGYNPDLLVEKTSSTPTTPALDPEMARLTSVQRQSEEAFPLDKKKVPFYSTKKGIIILVVVAAVIVIAAVVGGAVGGTRHKRTSTTSSGNEQGAPSSAVGSKTSPSTHSDGSPSQTSAPEITQGTGAR